MRRNIDIQTSGVPSNESASEIGTALFDGISENWIPNDSTKTTDKTFTSNGTYNAEDYGFYGFNRVVVNVAGGSGSESELSGARDGIYVSEYAVPPAGGVGSAFVRRDNRTNVVWYHYVSQSGELVKTPIPSVTSVTTKPRTEYSGPSDTVDYTGCVITLYYGDGTVADLWNDGVIEEGTQAWEDYIDVDDGPIGDVLRLQNSNRLVILHVRPWWFEGGTTFGREFSLRASYTIPPYTGL